MQIEGRITKKSRPVLWRPFIEGIKKYRLIEPRDAIAVCVSGGKDSMLLAKMMQLLLRYSDFPFLLHFICMDPGYHAANRRLIEVNAAFLGIPLHIFETDIFDAVRGRDRSPCYQCARMRRGHLYNQAKSLGCNKIALGHHQSDVVETVLMNVLYGGTFETMMPKLASRNYPGMELIRPLYLVHEDAIVDWVRYGGLEFIQCGCPLAENRAPDEGDGRRATVKTLVKEMKKNNPDVEGSIINATHRVNLERILGTMVR